MRYYRLVALCPIAADEKAEEMFWKEIWRTSAGLYEFQSVKIAKKKFLKCCYTHVFLVSFVEALLAF